eukprot:GHVO01011560.1.p1 GENE.GHVO01011560.1~~GHVO01011560.1.p1  ORF type:complete len:188 (+),score=18.44 GHVO01011560.1:36-599(+)
MSLMTVKKDVERIMLKVDARLQKIPLVMQICDRFSLRPIYVPGILLLVVLMIVGVFETLISNSVGFFYPAWQSFKAIESKDKKDDEQWLTYWVVYSSFNFLEVFIDYLLFWVPFYYLVKVIFLLWLFLPQFRGAKLLYDTLRPYLKKHSDTIDGIINHVTGAAASVVQGGADVAANEMRQRVNGSPN